MSPEASHDEAIVGPEAAHDEPTHDEPTRDEPTRDEPTPASEEVQELKHRQDVDTLEYRDKFGKTQGPLRDFVCKIKETTAALSKAKGNAPLISDLKGLHLETDIDLCGLDFSGWDISGATLVGVKLAYCDLRNANMKKTILSESNLHGATLK